MQKRRCYNPFEQDALAAHSSVTSRRNLLGLRGAMMSGCKKVTGAKYEGQDNFALWLDGRDVDSQFISGDEKWIDRAGGAEFRTYGSGVGSFAKADSNLGLKCIKDCCNQIVNGSQFCASRTVKFNDFINSMKGTVECYAYYPTTFTSSVGNAYAFGFGAALRGFNQKTSISSTYFGSVSTCFSRQNVPFNSTNALGKKVYSAIRRVGQGLGADAITIIDGNSETGSTSTTVDYTAYPDSIKIGLFGNPPQGASAANNQRSYNGQILYAVRVTSDYLTDEQIQHNYETDVSLYGL